MDYTLEENKFYSRRFLKDGDLVNSCCHYFMLSEKEPENEEANFFSAYYGYHTLLEESKYSTALVAFQSMIDRMDSAVEFVKKSDGDDAEKVMVLSAMVEWFTPITRYLFTGRISTTAKTIESGVLGLYTLGSAIKNNFESNPEALKLAVIPWKEAVSLQNTFYGYKYNGVKLEDYVAEIVKIDPTYTAPSTPIMKKIIDKIKGLFNK